jgi:hypothetical protein
LAWGTEPSTRGRAPSSRRSRRCLPRSGGSRIGNQVIEKAGAPPPPVGGPGLQRRHEEHRPRRRLTPDRPRGGPGPQRPPGISWLALEAPVYFLKRASPGRSAARGAKTPAYVGPLLSRERPDRKEEALRPPRLPPPPGELAATCRRRPLFPPSTGNKLSSTPPQRPLGAFPGSRPPPRAPSRPLSHPEKTPPRPPQRCHRGPSLGRTPRVRRFGVKKRLENA